MCCRSTFSRTTPKLYCVHWWRQPHTSMRNESSTLSAWTWLSSMAAPRILPVDCGTLALWWSVSSLPNQDQAEQNQQLNNPGLTVLLYLMTPFTSAFVSSYLNSDWVWKFSALLIAVWGLSEATLGLWNLLLTFCVGKCEVSNESVCELVSAGATFMRLILSVMLILKLLGKVGFFKEPCNLREEVFISVWDKDRHRHYKHLLYLQKVSLETSIKFGHFILFSYTNNKTYIYT